MSVAGVVLAAGRSERMGRSKALLEVGGRTFLERAIGTLARGGCAEVVTVLPAGGGSGRAGALARGSGATVVEAPHGGEQIDSLRAGIAALPEAVEAAVVLPVDHPLADAATVDTLIRAFERGRAPIVRPVWRDRPGHPVLFARSLWPELADPALERGARDVVHRHAQEIEDVPLDDRGVTVNVDTPADYAREVEG